MGACTRNLHCVLYGGYLWWNALLPKHKSPSKDTSFRLQRQSEGFLLGVQRVADYVFPLIELVR